MIKRTLLAAVVLAAAANAQTKLQLKVHTGVGVNGYDVNSTMISGDKDMLVIDPQFSLSEAHRLAAEILESKKNLVAIYVTHPHPDHLFGLAVLKQAFPSAKIVALPATVNGAKTGWPGRQKFWFPTYGNNIPGPEPVLPEELSTPVLTLEGEEFPITGGVQGDGPGNSFVYIPSAQSRRRRRYCLRSCLFRRAERQSPRGLDENPGSNRRLESHHRHPRPSGPRRDAEHGVDRVDEAIHCRLGCERRFVEEPGRDARESSPTIPGPRHGIHAQRPCRRVLPREINPPLTAWANWQC